MSQWEDARRLLANKLCGPARNGKGCEHSACDEALSALSDLDAGVFSERVRTVLYKRLCQPARNGAGCAHATCAEIEATLSAFEPAGHGR